jgi:hypothetical protein
MKASLFMDNSGASTIRICRRLGLTCWLIFFALLAVAPALAGDENEEFDRYHIRIEPFWFYAQPKGNFTSSAGRGFLDIHKDIPFQSYSSFSGKLDWKFTHKNHLYFAASDFDRTLTVSIARPITFQGQTFNVNSLTSGNLSALILIPGYQYDFIRRKQITLSVQAQLNIYDVSGSLNAAAQVNNGIPQTASAASGTIRAPLPVAGPRIRWYFIPNSGRLFVDANILGMYFFGYGNYVSSAGTLGFAFNRNVAIRGGYSLGSRAQINTKSNRLGLTLSQQGAIAGLEFSF